MASLGEIVVEIWSREVGGVWLGYGWSVGPVAMRSGWGTEVTMESMVQISDGHSAWCPRVDDRDPSSPCRPDNRQGIRDLLSTHGMGREMSAFIRGKNSTSPFWTAAMQGVASEAKFRDFFQRQDSPFVGLSGLMNTSVANLLDPANIQRGFGYCDHIVPNFPVSDLRAVMESVKETCMIPSVIGRVQSADALVRSPFDIEVQF